MIKFNTNYPLLKKGFTLIEILVVMSIIMILSVTLYINFNQIQLEANDEIRKNGLKELQIALKLYKAQNGKYPAAGCPDDTDPNRSPHTFWAGPGPITATWGKSCSDYIVGLVPEFMPALPVDPSVENDDNLGYLYATNPDRDAYKVLIYGVEKKMITGFDDEFARCPRATVSTWCGAETLQPNTYAIYTVGAEDW